MTAAPPGSTPSGSMLSRRLVLLSALVALMTGATGSQAGAEVGGGGPGAMVPAPAGPPMAESFRSVRVPPAVAMPVRLRIPALHVDTPLQRLGQATDQTIEVPSDFGVAGWYAEGPRPGQAGPAVILGHLDSRTGPGVFVQLSGVARGDEVAVVRADGSTVRFRVTDVLRVPKAGFPTSLVYGASLEPSLRLVTCGGRFDRSAGHYRDNVIVYADPVG
jgi:sortase (surface protein transpeptidase)